MTTTPTGNYAIDPTHSRIGFVARHAMITKVRGSFNEFEGTGYFDADDVSKSHLSIKIQAASIDTRNADRDGHLRSNDFFDMETFPEITFVSTSVKSGGKDVFTVVGDLTLKGITKQIEINFDYSGTAKDPFGNERLGLEGSVVVNRKDWGLEWNAPLDTGGVLVGDKVTLEFEVSAIKSA
jgi:polyisoprenoid-binding protein YceI